MNRNMVNNCLKQDLLIKIPLEEVKKLSQRLEQQEGAQQSRAKEAVTNVGGSINSKPNSNEDGGVAPRFKRPVSRQKSIKKLVQKPETSKNPATLQPTPDEPISTQVQAFNSPNRGPSQAQQATMKKILADRAVYYGEAQLPYLHSSDALNSLYDKSRSRQPVLAQPLLNPGPGTSPGVLCSLKSLYLYYTNLDSLRQLGTGWSNLKSLTVMCSPQLRDLSGLSIFPSLQYLFLPYNTITDISDLMYHGSLRCVDLEHNQLELLEQLEYLYTIVNLEWVDIKGNPIVRNKQKYRIVCENLGNKMQPDDNQKPFEYQQAQMAQDCEFYSYERIECSNSLIKEINQQIIHDRIEVGEVWRKAYHLRSSPVHQSEEPDVEIIASVDEEDNQDQVQKQVQIRVRPLVSYVRPEVSCDPLKKYFSNKLCLNLKQKPSATPGSQANYQYDVKQSASNTKEHFLKKFSLTQTLKSSVSEEKPRLSSVSVKKRLGKVSLGKFNSPSASLAPSLATLKNKQQLMPALGMHTEQSGLKFLRKKKLPTRNHEQLIDPVK